MRNNFSILTSQISFQKGFTLIEILIVLALIGILSLVFFVNFSVIPKARDTQRKADLEQIAKALEQYRSDNGVYPDFSNTGNPAGRYKIMIPDEGGGRIILNWGDSWLPYLSKLPQDPSSSGKYVYYSGSNQQSYYLYTSLEKPELESRACKEGSGSLVYCKSLIDNSILLDQCGGEKYCNYAVTSENVSP